MSNFASGYIKYINHLEQINDAALLNPQVMIDEVEDSYHEHIENIARNIVTHYKTAKVCMLAGPSSSGKTTTAHLLQRELGKLGVHAEIVSLDDFYLGPDETPVLPNGEKDYETVNALDIALIQDCLNSVIHSGSCLLPEYDFTTKTRTLAARKLDVSDRGFVIMEGLHALNPIFTRDLPEGSTIKLYVSVKQQIKDINGEVISPMDIRLVRRISRDIRSRDTMPERTIAMWDNVVAGEDKYIRPYRLSADYTVNSIHIYEPCVLRRLVIPLPQGIQHGNYLFGGIALRQVVAGAVVQNIPQQQQLVRLLALHGGKQLPAVKSRTVQVGCNHQFHGSSSGGGLDAAHCLIL